MAAVGTAGADRDEVFADINVTPLVDVTLVLLVIMMVTAPMIVEEAITVDLPVGKTAVPTVAGGLTIVLTREGRLFVGGEPRSEETIDDDIRSAVAKNPQVEATIAADRTVAYGKVAGLIDRVRSLGVTRLALQIEPATGRR